MQETTLTADQCREIKKKLAAVAAKGEQLAADALTVIDYYEKALIVSMQINWK